VRTRGAHDGGEALDALAVKSRLRQAALAAPELPFAGEQTFANEGLHPADERAFPVIAIVVLQDMLDVIGMVQEMDGQKRRRVEADDIPVLTRGPAQHGQRIAARRKEEMEGGRIALAGGAAGTVQCESGCV
jgi:hypothetical protein